MHGGNYYLYNKQNPKFGFFLGIGMDIKQIYNVLQAWRTNF